MKKYEELYVLIKSLGTAEKRHFTQSVTGAKQKNYLRLFKAIDRQEQYDEAAIRLTFKGETFLKQLHVTKHYLKQLILKNLRNFHRTSRYAEIHDLLRNAEILYNKELYTLCRQEIDKAHRLALAYEFDVLLLEILDWKKKLVQILRPGELDEVKHIQGVQKTTLDRIDETFAHVGLTVATTASYGRPEILHELDESILEVEPQSLEAKVHYFHSRFHLALLNEEKTKAAKLMHELIALLESNDMRLDENPRLYFSTINNALAFYTYGKQYDTALALIEKARTRVMSIHQGAYRKIATKQILRMLNIELEIYRNNLPLIRPQIIEEIAGYLDVRPDPVPEVYRPLFYFQLASIQFRKQNLHDALTWLSRLINLGSRAARQDLQLYGRILNLIIHLELNNVFVLGYFIDNTRRFLKSRKINEEWIDRMIRFFSRMRNVPDYEFSDAYHALKVALFPNGKSLIPVEALDYVDIRAWLDRKCGVPAVVDQ